MAASLLQLSVVPRAFAATATVTAQPNPGSDVAPYFSDPATQPSLSQTQLVQLLRQKIKYVFVIFNENHSFDNEYGTFPGVNGLYSDGQQPRSAANTPGFTQTYTDANGGTVTVQPFLIGPAQNATVVDSVDHSHTGLATKINVVNNVPQMDKFALDEYTRFASKGDAASIAQGTQYARLVMSHIDCNTIPFFWQWASRFTIFDNIFATENTPSTPNAVAMLAGQSGETQWVKHGPSGQLYKVGLNSGITQGPPLVNDPQPFYGSQFDTTTQDRQPAGSQESYSNGNPASNPPTSSNIASNLTFASLPLTFEGSSIKTVLASNKNPSFDLPDVQQDIPYIQSFNSNQVNWRWYQEGYNLEPTDKNGIASHYAYVSHHNGAQYFGYISNTPQISNASLRGLNDFFTDIASNKLPQGGVFYIRGGYTNQQRLLPPITNPNTPADEIQAIYAAKIGDDDHPGYTDRQISEAMNARAINAIANSKIWSQSAIIITYDESDGFYDHVPPRILSYGPDKLPLARGIRIPLILISPYGRTHAVSHVEGDHNAIIETINYVFGLPALSDLPDEKQALAAGNSSQFNQFGPSGFQQRYLGPRDTNSSTTDSLLSGFDPERLQGNLPPLPASLALIPENVVNTLPHYSGNGCQTIGITPEGQRQGIVNNIPPGFNPLPSTYTSAN
ncbi:MAG: hypothetical protein JO235_01315 [Chroococcidiopsidaceae cyanobacterium CP_BM_RX_35]|nr:hypothetical protein [Chroococcidiopsidaceae cyanobacterium CP_BM_RX_35]